MKLTVRFKGGEGSGHHDHAGRPGKVGGSLPGKGIDPYPGKAPPSIGEGPADNPWEEDADLNDYIVSGLAFEGYGDESRNVPLNDYSIADTSIRTDVKKEIVTKLSEMSGLPYDEVNDLVAQWARTSNDNDLRALLLQQDIADELGLELSDWQKANILELYSVKDRSIKLGLEHVKSLARADDAINTVEEYIEYTYGRALHHHNEIMSLPISERMDYMMPAPEKLSVVDAERILIGRAFGDGLSAHKYFRLYPKENQMKFARAMYDHTQNSLMDNSGEQYRWRPGDHIRLFRGFNTGVDEPKFQWVPPADSVVGYFGNAIESWSFSYEVAEDFGNTVIVMDVPIENIIGTCRTGFGCLTEGEFVIAANVRTKDIPHSYGQKAYVVTIPKSRYAPDAAVFEGEYDASGNPILQ